MNFLDLSFIERGGPVMVPLLLVSLVGFILFFERLLFLHSGQIRADRFVAGLKNLLAKRRLIEALTLCESTPGPLGHVAKAALLHHGDGEDRMRTAVEEAALVQIPVLERRIASLGAIARIAPMLGLLGTVLGLFATFRQLGSAGAYPHFDSMAAGFSEALISTAFGLSIGIIAFTAHHFLSGRVRAVVQDMEWTAHVLMQYLLRDLPDDVEEIASTDEA